MNEKYQAEYQKLLEIGKKKGSLYEEDIQLRFMKYEATAKETDEIIEMLKANGIKVLSQVKEEIDFDALASQVSVDDPVKMYLKDIGKVPLLTAEQEVELAKRILDGDEEAKSKLCEANLRLGISSAQRYTGKKMQFGGLDHQSQEPWQTKQEQLEFQFTWWKQSTNLAEFPKNFSKNLAENQPWKN